MTTRWWKGKFPMPKGPMTIDKLARMVQVGFMTIQDSARTSFVAMGARFDSLERRVTAMERFAENRFDHVDDEIRMMSQRFNQVVDIHEYATLEHRVAALERKVRIRVK